jgi:hypothetical protein
MMHALELDEQHRTTSRVLLQAAISLLVLIALVDVSDMMLHLKAPAFVTVFFIWFYRQFTISRRMDRERHHKLPRHVWMTTLGVTVVVPMLWISIGLLNSDLHSGDAPLGLLKTFLFFSIVLVLVSEEIDLISYILKLSIALAVATIAVFVIGLISPELSLGIGLFVAGKGNGLITPNRTLFGVEFGEVYYGGCPIMVFPFAYYCDLVSQYGLSKLSSVFMCSLFGIALLLTGARADILVALSIALIFALRYIRRVSGWVPALIVGLMVVIFAAAIVIPDFTDKKEVSNAVKLKHIHSYYEEFSARPAVLLSGEGANTAFYSDGFGVWTTVTEVTYFELVRVFGLPMVFLFVFGLLWIGYSLFAHGLLPIGVAYLGFLVIAASNPLLVGSTGFLVIAAMYEQAVRCSGRPLPRHNQFRLWGHALPNRR